MSMMQALLGNSTNLMQNFGSFTKIDVSFTQRRVGLLRSPSFLRSLKQWKLSGRPGLHRSSYQLPTRVFALNWESKSDVCLTMKSLYILFLIVTILLSKENITLNLSSFFKKVTSQYFQYYSIIDFLSFNKRLTLDFACDSDKTYFSPTKLSYYTHIFQKIQIKRVGAMSISRQAQISQTDGKQVIKKGFYRVIWIDENCQSNFNKPIVDYLKQEKIAYQLSLDVQDAVDYLLNAEFSQNQYILVMCTNSNCDKVQKTLKNTKRIVQFIIFCGNLEVGRKNVKRLGGKFSQAFVKSTDIMQYLKVFCQQSEIHRIRGISKHEEEMKKSEYEMKKLEKAKNKEESTTEKQQVKPKQNLQQSLIQINLSENLYSKNHEPIQKAKSNINEQSQLSDIQIQQKMSLNRATYKFIGNTFKLIGGEVNRQMGQKILQFQSTL